MPTRSRASISLRSLRSQSETENCPSALTEDTLAKFFVQVDPGFGVAAGGELVTAAEQFLAELRVFVELAFEGDPDVVLLVGHRLPAAGDVDDREPPRAERDARLDVDVLVIRTAVRDRGRHAQAVDPQGKCRRPARSTAPAIPHMQSPLNLSPCPIALPQRRLCLFRRQPMIPQMRAHGGMGQCRIGCCLQSASR